MEFIRLIEDGWMRKKGRFLEGLIGWVRGEGVRWDKGGCIEDLSLV